MSIYCFIHNVEKWTKLEKEAKTETENYLIAVEIRTARWLSIYGTIILFLGSLFSAALYVHDHHHVTHQEDAIMTGFDDGWASACKEIFSKSPSNGTLYWQGNSVSESECKFSENSYINDLSTDYRDLKYVQGVDQVLLQGEYSSGYSYGFDKGQTASKSNIFNRYPELCYGVYCLNFQNVNLTSTHIDGQNFLNYK